MALTKATYSMIEGAPVSVIDYGADPTGVADSTAAIQAARDFVAAAPDEYKLVFPAGTYKYSVSPNFGVTNMCVEAQGTVYLNYTGTGNCLIFDAGVAPALVYNARFTGSFIVEGGTSSQNGIYWRSIHHSKIDCRVDGCGPTYSGLRTEFSVCSEFNVVVSTNENPFGANKPLYGYFLSQRNVGEKTSANTFYNPIIEGVGSHGIYLNYADQNTFIGGTSEANLAGYGVYVPSLDSLRNTFINTDFEVNLGSVYDAGLYNTYINTLSDGPINVSGRNINFIGGQLVGGITNSGTLNLDDCAYSGTITNTGKISRKSLYNITGAFYEKDLKMDSLSKTTTGVASGTPTTVLTLPSTGDFFYNVYAYFPNAGPASDFGAWAVVYKTGSSTRILTQQNGSVLSLTLSGLNVVATQTAGGPINIAAVAQVM